MWIAGRWRPGGVLLAGIVLLAGAAPAAGGPAGPAAGGQLEAIVALEAVALAHERAGRLAEAIRVRVETVELAGVFGRPRITAALAVRLGQALEAANRVQDAVLAYERGLLALQGDPALDAGRVLGAFGGLTKEFAAQRTTAPLDLYSPSLEQELETAADDAGLLVKLLVNVGNAYARQPQPSVALHMYDLALARPEIDAEPLLRARVLVNAGQIRRALGETRRAETALVEALDLMRRHGALPEKRRALTLLAGIQRDRRAYGEAEATYREALALYAAAHDPRGEGRAYAGLGRLELERRRFAAARAAFERAVRQGVELGDDEILWHAYWGLGLALRALGQLDAAAGAFEQALPRIERWRGQLATDEGKVSFLESVRDAFDQLVEVHLARAAVDPRAYADALAVAEEARGRATADLMGGRWRAGRPAGPGHRPRCEPGFDPVSRVAELVAARASPAQMVVGARSPADAPPWEPEDGQASRPSRPAANGPGAPAAEVRRPSPLPRLVFHVLEDRTAVFAVSRTGAVRGHVAPAGRDALAGYIARIRATFRVERDVRGLAPEGPAAGPSEAPLPAYEPLLRELYDLLVAPVADALPPEGEHLALEPHEALWLLPFAALRLSDGGWLGDRWPLVYAPSADALDEVRGGPARVRPSDASALVVGDPIPPPQVDWAGLHVRFRPLQGAAAEAASLGRLFGASRATVLTDRQADLKTVLDSADRYDVLHLATHGIASASDPLGSFVVLGESPCGQLLTARQVMELPLRADLVVLSACQTGLGRIAADGVIGLSRAFLVAGARTVVVSLWSVSDKATVALMEAFYERYLAGMDKASALREAMRQVRARGGYAHPRLWAPFVLVGAE